MQLWIVIISCNAMRSNNYHVSGFSHFRFLEFLRDQLRYCFPQNRFLDFAQFRNSGFLQLMIATMSKQICKPTICTFPDSRISDVLKFRKISLVVFSQNRFPEFEQSQMTQDVGRLGSKTFDADIEKRKSHNEKNPECVTGFRGNWIEHIQN